MTEVFLVSCDGVLGLGRGWIGGWVGGWVWGFSSHLLNVVPCNQSVILHNFLISQHLSLISLRIALSIPELHESEGDLQKGARFLGILKY